MQREDGLWVLIEWGHSPDGDKIEGLWYQWSTGKLVEKTTSRWSPLHWMPLDGKVCVESPTWHALVRLSVVHYRLCNMNDPDTVACCQQVLREVHNLLDR